MKQDFQRKVKMKLICYLIQCMTFLSLGLQHEFTLYELNVHTHHVCQVVGAGEEE